MTLQSQTLIDSIKKYAESFISLNLIDFCTVRNTTFTDGLSMLVTKRFTNLPYAERISCRAYDVHVMLTVSSQNVVKINITRQDTNFESVEQLLAASTVDHSVAVIANFAKLALEQHLTSAEYIAENTRTVKMTPPQIDYVSATHVISLNENPVSENVSGLESFENYSDEPEPTDAESIIEPLPVPTNFVDLHELANDIAECESLTTDETTELTEILYALDSQDETPYTELCHMLDSLAAKNIIKFSINASFCLTDSVYNVYVKPFLTRENRLDCAATMRRTLDTE